MYHRRIARVSMKILKRLRPEPNFVRATYVPCTYDVPATFTWRNNDIYIRMEIHFRRYSVSMRMYYVRVAYVWCMKCTRDVSTAHVLHLGALLTQHLPFLT